MIEKFLTYLQYEKNYSKHTITAYKNDLFSVRDFCVTEFNQEKLEEIHYNQIRSWIVSLVNKQITNRSINRKVSSLKAFYKYLQAIGEMEVNPLSKHKALKVQKKIQVPFSRKEMEEVIESVKNDNDFEAVRNKLIIELFYSTGIRRIELINVKEVDINIEEATVKVLGKRNKERLVPLLPSVVKTLKDYLLLKRNENLISEFLFVTKKGDKIYETLVYRTINSYFGQVSTKVKKSPHILRHTFATHLLNQGADLNSVKELLGHSSLASTQVYTHNSLEQLKKVFNKAHPRELKNK